MDHDAAAMLPAPLTSPPLPMRGDTVLVLGLGESGLAMARWCARAGAQLRWWDSREHPPGAEALAREWPAAKRAGFAADPPPPAGAAEGSGSVAAALEGVTLVLKSPGLAPYDPRIAPLTQEARARGLPVLGELDLFVRALAALKAGRGYAPQLLAVTGTNGKTTTTAMTALLVERAGKRVGLAGNIGPTLLDTLAQAIAAEALPDVWVLELSSFQLEGGGTGVAGFEPDAAAVLNVTQDHLDWHGSMAAYATAKARIFGPADGKTVRVINRDDPLVEAMAQPPAAAAPDAGARGRGKPGPGKAAAAAKARPIVRFGLGAPARPGDFGLVVDNGMAWLVRALPADETLVKKKRRPSVPAPPVAQEGAGHDEEEGAATYAARADDGDDTELHLQRLMPADALRVRGRHNAANALAALALATAIGCPLHLLLHGLREYAGEPHRVQWVASVGDVEAYDDSKGTNVGATVAALVGLGADKAPARLAVILGGDGKGQDFSPLAAPVARHARAVATLGRDAAAIEAALAESAAAAGVPVVRHESLEAATRWCFAQARAGDAVLLSPACASLDMFRNYGHRAEVFVQAVQALAHERGAV
ncbi:MAG: UDP-N-acetylmuramoyl-L-alanine--D-glutamate ligase [Rubrivivax sp.]|nr:UDP-N-acetylmuramoyl-L-alanine--D-glutamate ligase [Rubrivivax sp.]